MRRNLITFIMVMVALGGVVGAEAQKKTTKKPVVKKAAPKVGAKPSPSESTLVGVRLYDPGTKIVAMFGSPTEIQAVAFGGSNGGGSGGGGTAPGPKGAGGGGGLNPSGGAAPPGIRDDMGPGLSGMIGDPFGMSGRDRQLGEPGLNPNFSGGGGAPAAGGGKGGGGGAAGMGGGTTGSTSSGIIFTRWVYNRGGSQYGFVFDKYNRVVQIEAIGIADPRVRSKRGVVFGTPFATVIKKYNAPEGYEINSDNIMLRYLQRDKVAFRLSRLKPNGPHQVTGIVIAAGSK